MVVYNMLIVAAPIFDIVDQKKNEIKRSIEKKKWKSIDELRFLYGNYRNVILFNIQENLNKFRLAMHLKEQQMYFHEKSW